MELIILLAANAVLGLVNLVLTIINLHNTEKANYNLISEMIDVEMNELAEELHDYFRGEF
jgi:hypothetical protein